jgi:ABC-type transport system substrate-binding protein
MVAGDMNAIGLNATLVPVDVAVWGERFYASDAGNYDMLTSFMGRSNRYPSRPASSNLGLNPISNPSLPDDKPPVAYTEAYRRLIASQDIDEQRSLAVEMEKIILDESWDIAVAYQRAQYAMVPDLKGFAISRDDWIIVDGMYWSS